MARMFTHCQPHSGGNSIGFSTLSVDSEMAGPIELRLGGLVENMLKIVYEKNFFYRSVVRGTGR